MGTKLKLTTLPGYGRAYLKVVNGIFLAISIIIIGSGILLYVGESIISEFIKSVTMELTKMAGKSGRINVDLTLIDYSNHLGSSGVVTFVLILGLCCCIMSFIGLMGAKRYCHCLLVTYAVFIWLWLIIQVTMVTVVAVNQGFIKRLGESTILSTIRTSYLGYNGTDVISVGWNFVMLTVSCCGYNDFGDFNVTLLWNKCYLDDDQYSTLMTPLACCNYDDTGLYDFSCAVSPSPQTSHYLKGCFDAVWSRIDPYASFIVVFVSAMLIIQFILACSAVVLTIAVRKGRKRRQTDSAKSAQTGNSRGGIFDGFRKRVGKEHIDELSEGCRTRGDHSNIPFGIESLAGLGFQFGAGIPTMNNSHPFASIQRLMAMHSGMFPYSDFFGPTSGLSRGMDRSEMFDTTPGGLMNQSAPFFSPTLAPPTNLHGEGLQMVSRHPGSEAQALMQAIHPFHTIPNGVHPLLLADPRINRAIMGLPSVPAETSVVLKQLLTQPEVRQSARVTRLETIPSVGSAFEESFGLQECSDASSVFEVSLADVIPKPTSRENGIAPTRLYSSSHRGKQC